MEYKNRELNYIENIDESEKVANMLLFGEIGSERRQDMINGDEFAREMVFLSEIGFKTIKMHINSIGGNIIKGMSVINSMNIVRMNGVSIETHIIGIADSMAGMISAFGDRGKRTIANFGSGTVHEPLARTKEGKSITIKEMEDGPLKTEALNMLDSLVNLMVSSTGKSKTDVKKAMKEGKRLTSSEMKSFGMVDKVLRLSNESVDIQNKTAIELMAACSNIKVESKSKTMKEINKILNLSEDAAENSAVKAIMALQNKVKDQEGLLETETAKVTKLKGENEVLVNAATEVADATAEAYVDSLINAGKFEKEKREVLVNQAKENFDGFKTMTESLGVTFVDVTKEIKNGGTNSGDKLEELAKVYHGHHVAGTLANLEKESPVKFKKMEDAYLNSTTDFDLN